EPRTPTLSNELVSMAAKTNMVIKRRSRPKLAIWRLRPTRELHWSVEVPEASVEHLGRTEKG
ncbi:hypothetical protein Ancab_007357, partial [Ancistrocladus abbreviatus]